MSRGGVFDIGPFSAGPLAKRARYEDDRSKGKGGGKFGKGGKGGKFGKGKSGGHPGPLSVFRSGAPKGTEKGKGWEPRPPWASQARADAAAEDPGPLDEGLLLDIQGFVDERGGQVEGGQIGAHFNGVKKTQLKPHFDIVDVGGGKYWVRQQGFDGPIPDDTAKLDAVLAAEGIEEEAQDMPDEPLEEAAEDPYLADVLPEEDALEPPMDDGAPEEVPPAEGDDDEYTQSLLRRVEELKQELADVLAAKGLQEEDLPSSKLRQRLRPRGKGGKGPWS
ncbi:Zcchc6 [Symbiodinium natans]|uniref:Zcchc6 protein n=1 Tax=Symbiodinium natans TaxID=878477 RepID=A0A812K6I1_9DINO|nr:Zcchc6 [Symbiodinium natans]